MSWPWPMPGMSLPAEADGLGLRCQDAERDLPVRGDLRRDHLRALGRAESRGLCRRFRGLRGGQGPCHYRQDGYDWEDGSSMFIIRLLSRIAVDSPAGDGAIASEIRVRNSTSISASFGRNATTNRSRNGSLSVHIFSEAYALVGQGDATGATVVRCGTRATNPRCSNSTSMARIVLASEEARRTRSCWVIPSVPPTHQEDELVGRHAVSPDPHRSGGASPSTPLAVPWGYRALWPLPLPTEFTYTYELQKKSSAFRGRSIRKCGFLWGLGWVRLDFMAGLERGPAWRAFPSMRP